MSSGGDEGDDGECKQRRAAVSCECEAEASSRRDDDGENQICAEDDVNAQGLSSERFGAVVVS